MFNPEQDYTVYYRATKISMDINIVPSVDDVMIRKLLNNIREFGTKYTNITHQEDAGSTAFNVTANHPSADMRYDCSHSIIDKVLSENRTRKVLVMEDVDNLWQPEHRNSATN